MLVLHMAEMDGSLVLWGERPADDRPAGEGMHPWSATPRELKAALPPLRRGTAFTVTAWLPSTRGGPAPSSGIIAEVSATPAKISPWNVRAYGLSYQDAAAILNMAYGRRALEDGAIIGEDMAWWADVLRQAVSMVARQQYLPDAIPAGDGTYVGAWSPVFAGEEAGWIGAAAARMPAAARALTHTNAKGAPSKPAAASLWSVLSSMIDHTVRTSVRNMERRKRTRFTSIHDAWLYSLRSKHRTISGAPGMPAQLAGQVREWHRPITIMAVSPFRLCFRIEEPEGDGDVWNIRYLVQPNDDPSMLIPVDMAWRGAEHANLKGHILFALGHAAEICPDISAGLSLDGTAGHTTDTAGAHRFLVHEAEALRQTGYGVIVPSWWTGRGNRRRLTAKARVRAGSPGSGMLSMDSVMQFDWEVALGDQAMSIEELEGMAALKTSLVRMRGMWTVVGAEEIRAAINLLQKGRAAGSLRDAVRMELGVGDAPEDLEWGGISSADGISDVLGRLGDHTSMEDIDPPAGFTGNLRPYQRRGYSWLSFLRRWGLGGCLADDMGLGKTVQMLALLQLDREAGETRPALLVCPTSVINNWKREAARFAPELRVLVHHGAGRARGEKLGRAAAGHDVVVTSYGLLLRDVAAMRDVQWSGVILDEAQNIKNSQTKQAHAVRSIPSDYRFALTGTPVENSVADLWSIMEFLNPGFLGGPKSFRQRFLIPIQSGLEQGATERLRRATGPFILRRLKTDRSIISDLPDKIEIKEYCSMTKEQATLYASVLRETERALEEAEGIQRRGIILGTLSKLKQVCNHPAHFLGDSSAIPERSGKLERLREMLEEVVESGDKALIFTQFVEMGHMLKRYIQEALGREVLFLHGGTPRRQRDSMVERFGDDGSVQVFVVSLKAGGTGLNLTAASHVFHFDRWWNPAVEDQATDRAFRIGQTRNVQVRKMICAGTFEEKIDQMIEQKKEMAKSVVGTGEAWLTELSNDELRDVLALSQEAVA